MRDQSCWDKKVLLLRIWPGIGGFYQSVRNGRRAEDEDVVVETLISFREFAADYLNVQPYVKLSALSE